LNRFLGDTMHGMARDGVQKLLLLILLGLSAFLIGTAGFGFLIACGFLMLSTAWGAELAALALGLGLTLLAVVLGIWVKRHWWNTARTMAPETDAPAAKTPEDAGRDAASQVAFTAAFVLGRYLIGGGRG